MRSDSVEDLRRIFVFNSISVSSLHSEGPEALFIYWWGGWSIHHVATNDSSAAWKCSLIHNGHALPGLQSHSCWLTDQTSLINAVWSLKYNSAEKTRKKHSSYSRFTLSTLWHSDSVSVTRSERVQQLLFSSRHNSYKFVNMNVDIISLIQHFFHQSLFKNWQGKIVYMRYLNISDCFILTYSTPALLTNKTYVDNRHKGPIFALLFVFPESFNLIGEDVKLSECKLSQPRQRR